MTTNRPYIKGLTDCPGCGRLLRPRSARSDMYNVPTIGRYGQGMCWPCYHDRKGRPVNEQPSEAAVREAFEAYIRSRRLRGIPEEGLKVAS